MSPEAKGGPILVFDPKSALRTEGQMEEWGKILNDLARSRADLVTIACSLPVFVIPFIELVNGLGNNLNVASQRVNAPGRLGTNAVGSTPTEALVEKKISYVLINHPEQEGGRSTPKEAVAEINATRDHSSKEHTINPILFVQGVQEAQVIMDLLGDQGLPEGTLIANVMFAENGDALNAVKAGEEAEKILKITGAPVLHVGKVNEDNVSGYLIQDAIAGVVFGTACTKEAFLNNVFTAI